MLLALFLLPMALLPVSVTPLPAPHALLSMGLPLAAPALAEAVARAVPDPLAQRASQVAQVLGGRPGELLAGQDEARRKRVAAYARGVENGWAGYEARMGAPMAQWAAQNLERTPGETIFYPFSGPDFVTVHRLYPEAARYVLVAIQRAGRVPDLLAAPDAHLEAVLSLFGQGMVNFTRRGYFITNEMKEEFVPGDAVDGFLGVLLLFAEREGFDVTGVLPLHVAADGHDLERHPGDPEQAETWDSVRLVLKRRADGARVLLDYAKVDLGDWNVSRNKAVHAWLDSMCHHRVLLKAASHLLQTGGFRELRGMLLANPPSILQDDSGLDYADLASAFQVRLFGRYKEANRAFAGKNYQESLLKAYQAAGKDVPRVPFRFGYEKVAGTAIQLGVRPADGKSAGTER
jgi:hypothetical protein